MIMSSYLMDSNYIDPKFPPCEEYSQNSYIPEHSPEYYSRTRDTGYQHHHQDLYPPRVTYPDRQYNCASIPEPEPQRGHGLTHSGSLLAAGKAQTTPREPPPPFSHPPQPHRQHLPPAFKLPRSFPPAQPRLSCPWSTPGWRKSTSVPVGIRTLCCCFPLLAHSLLHVRFPLPLLLFYLGSLLEPAPCNVRCERSPLKRRIWGGFTTQHWQLHPP